MSTKLAVHLPPVLQSVPVGGYLFASVCIFGAALLAAIYYATTQSWPKDVINTVKSELLRRFPYVVFTLAKAYPQSNSSGRFSINQFRQDLKHTAVAIGAPYSEKMTDKVLNAYGPLLHDSVVLWRATDSAGSGLNYRFSKRYPVDALTPALQAGLLQPTNPSVKLVNSWFRLYPGKAMQLCDFDSQIGLVKHWILMIELGSVDDVLFAEGVPEPIRAHCSTFHKLGLERVRFTAVDYQKGSVNLYFVVPGPVNASRLTELVALTGNKQPLNTSRLAELQRYLSSEEFHFAVTLRPNGLIERVAFYALKVSDGTLPELGPRLQTYISAAPSYDATEMHILAWSFDPKGKCSMKLERSYCGGLYELLAGWGGKFSEA